MQNAPRACSALVQGGSEVRRRRKPDQLCARARSACLLDVLPTAERAALRIPRRKEPSTSRRVSGPDAGGCGLRDGAKARPAVRIPRRPANTRREQPRHLDVRYSVCLPECSVSIAVAVKVRSASQPVPSCSFPCPLISVSTTPSAKRPDICSMSYRQDPILTLACDFPASAVKRSPRNTLKMVVLNRAFVDPPSQPTSLELENAISRVGFSFAFRLPSGIVNLHPASGSWIVIVSSTSFPAAGI